MLYVYEYLNRVAFLLESKKEKYGKNREGKQKFVKYIFNNTKTNDIILI